MTIVRPDGKKRRSRSSAIRLSPIIGESSVDFRQQFEIVFWTFDDKNRRVRRYHI